MGRITKIIILLIIFSIICCIIDKDFIPVKTTVTICDTTYSVVILDSIKYNIKVKDSIIVELKKKVTYEMEQAINADDSTAVVQFKELASSN